MKRQIILLAVLGGLITIVLFSDYSAGTHHVKTIDENTVLVKENGNLKSEVKNLKSENSKLKSNNLELATQLTSINKVLSAKTKEASTKLPKAIVNIEEELEIQLGWCTPEIAYDLLTEKLGNEPTKEEYQKTLLDLLKKDMLYEPGTPDPYVRGKKFTISKINKIISSK